MVMRNFLDDFISSLIFGNKRRASAILDTAKLEKSQLDALVKRLMDSDALTNVILTEEDENSLITSGSVRSNLLDVNLAIKDIFRVSNEISLLLDSHTAVLGSEVSAMEKEIDALEKAVSNYAFLLSDAKAYDYSYLESFSDKRGEDMPDWGVPDRGNLTFLPTEKAFIDTEEGILTAAQDFFSTFPLTAKIIKTNIRGYITSDTGIDNSTIADTKTGWRMSVSTPTSVKATLKDYVGFHGQTSFPGALIVVEYNLDQPAPCDTIKVDGFSDASFEVVQTRIYKSLSSDENQVVLSSPVEINGVHNIFFPLQAVARFRLYLRQHNYKHNPANPINSEVVHKKAHDEVIKDRSMDRQVSSGYLQRVYIQLHEQNMGALGNLLNVSIPIRSFTNKNSIALDRLLQNIRKDERNPITWTNSNLTNRLMERIIRSLYANSSDVFSIFTKAPETMSSSIAPSVVDKGVIVGGKQNQTSHIATDPQQDLADVPGTDKFKCEYNIGIKHISIGANVKAFKSVFVSKQIPAPGDIGELRIKSSDFNYKIQDSDRDSPVVTSIEYSVTNKSQPEDESDWLPVLPVNYPTARAERVLPNSFGHVNFRFAADPKGDLSLYKNGYIMTLDRNSAYIYGPGNESITGLNIPSTEYSQSDILTVDYLPAGNVSVINFANAGFSEVPLVSSFDEDGAGEGFSGTNGQLSIGLSYFPYIDRAEVNASTYSTVYGLTPYTPIIIRFQDGTIPINLTNYLGGAQVSPDPTSPSYQFIHSGDTILFNKMVSQAFRVYYQYLPSNVRVRIVLRTNHKDFISPKVDSFQLKAKTRKSDARSM